MLLFIEALFKLDVDLLILPMAVEGVRTLRKC